MTEENNNKNNEEMKIYHESHGTGVVSSMIFLGVVCVVMYFLAKAMGM